MQTPDRNYGISDFGLGIGLGVFSGTRGLHTAIGETLYEFNHGTFPKSVNSSSHRGGEVDLLGYTVVISTIGTILLEAAGYMYLAYRGHPEALLFPLVTNAVAYRRRRRTHYPW